VGLLLACDVVLAASDARFGLGEVRLGLCPVLVAPLFAAAVGRRVAGRYLLTGDGFDAEEARRIGVVHEVVPPAELRDELDAYAARLVAAGPGSVAATKRLLWGRRALLSEAWDIDWIVEETVRYRASPEAAEGVSAFLEKRAPAWLGAS
jgi:methylglutaconyl-CoA hydratase